MTRRRTRSRPTVIQHTSMVSQPITVDLCSPQQSMPSCIDLTNDPDDAQEIVDLTTLPTANDSVVCLGQTPQTVDTVTRIQERRALRAQRHDHSYRTTNQTIDVDLEHSNSSDEVLPVFNIGRKSWKEKQQPVEDPSMKRVICPICLDDIPTIQRTERQLVSTVCGHVFCNACIREAIRTHHTCPNCRKRLTVKQFHPLFI